MAGTTEFSRARYDSSTDGDDETSIFTQRGIYQSNPEKEYIERNPEELLHCMRQMNEHALEATSFFCGSPYLPQYHLPYVPSSTFVCQYQVFDMRKSQTFTESQRDQRLLAKTGLTDQALKKCVCEQFSTTAEQVQIVHFDMKTEGSALKTTVVILPEIVQNMPFNKLLIETYTDEHRLSRIICGLWKADIKVDEFKQMLMEFLGWKSIALCKDGRIIYNAVEDQLRENQDLTRVQAFQFGHMKVTLVYSINADSEYRFICTLNGAKSVLEAKEKILTKFSREFEAINETKGQILHLCIRDQIIQDDICLGVAMQSITRRDDTPISLHFASQDAITVTIVSNELKMRQKLLIVPRLCSTAYLRERIGKLAACDANSIKLVFNEKLIDELDDLSQTYGYNWKSGCTLNVGLKKQKTLKIKNPINNEEKAFKMYMLEPVQKFVERISAHWNLDVLTMCLFCRDVPMKCNSLLQHYAIKNNMQLELKLFPNRIAIQVRIVFKKRTLNLAVADSTVTAVEDLLTYCAVKMQYPRKCSRAILRNKCLKPEASLKDEGFSTNEKVSIVFFDEPLSGNSELIPVFEADIDGHTTPRYGKVVEGLLLLAPESQRLPPPVRGSDRDHLPSGIDLYEKTLDSNRSKIVPHREACATKQTKPSVVMKQIKKKFMKRSASLIDIWQRKLSEQRNSLSAADTGFESSHADSSMSTTNTRFKSFYADGNMSAAFTGHGSSHADSSMSTTSTGQESLHADSSMSTTDTGQESLQSESGMSKKDTVHKILHANSCITGISEQQKENVFGQTTGFVSSVDKDQSCCDTSRKTTEMFYVPSSDPETSSEVRKNDELPSVYNCKRCTHAHNTDESDGCHGEVSTEAPYTSSEHIIKEFTCIKHCIKKIEKSIVNQSLHGSAPDSADSSSQSSVEGQDEDRNQRAFNNGVNLSSSLKKGQVQPDNHCSNKVTQASNQTPAPLSEFSSNSASNTHFTPVSTAEAQVVPYSTEHAQASASTALEGISPHHQSCHSQHATLPNQICRFCLHQFAPRVLESEQYLRSCPYLYSLFRSRQAAARQGQRPHYNSEGDSHQQQIIESIHHSSTYPSLRDEHQWIREDMSVNDDLNSAGITTCILDYVSTRVGRAWQRMLRELNIEEPIIDDLEKYKNMQESAYQGLLVWKRRFGREATLKQLGDCLRAIGLTSVAEQINGHFTA